MSSVAMSKTLALIVAVLVIVVVAGGAYWYISQQKPQEVTIIWAST